VWFIPRYFLIYDYTAKVLKKTTMIQKNNL